MIKALSSDIQEGFEEILQAAVRIHNSSPHTATGQSPFFYLFGCEPTIPGWQGLQAQNKDMEVRHHSVQEERAKTAYRKSLMEESQLTMEKSIPKIGGWIIFPLSDYEKEVTEGSRSKYSSSWSLPAKVREVRDKICIVKTWEGRERQVPISQVFKLIGEVAPSLQEANVKVLERWDPLQMPTTSPPPSTKSTVQWDEFLDKEKEKKNAREPMQEAEAARKPKRVKRA